MDDYSTKIKISAEHLIRVVFPEKALELDTLVSVRILLFSFYDDESIFLSKESSIIIQ